MRVIRRIYQSIRIYRAGSYRGFAVYGDLNHNPFLAIQHGPGGWLLITRRRQWLTPSGIKNKG